MALAAPPYELHALWAAHDLLRLSGHAVTAAKIVQAEPLPIAVPSVAHEFWFACGCLEPHCTRAGFQADALPYVVAAELRGMAGELMARHDMDRRLSAYSAALVLLARAEALGDM